MLGTKVSCIYEEMKGIKENDPCCTGGGGGNTSSNAFELALEALLYDGDGVKIITHQTLKLIEAAISTGNPDAPLLMGIRKYQCHGEAYQYLHEAEQKGSRHPLLMYYIGQCLVSGDKGIEMDLERALDYYNKAIEGM